MDSLGWKYYLVYVGWLLVEIVTFWFLYPETKGYTLEGTQEAFGDDAKFDGPEKAMDLGGDLCDEKLSG